MDRARNSGRRLTESEVAEVKGMLLRGDRQHDIAAWFGVNGGRIGEISKGRKFFDVRPKTSSLPRSGPYLSGQAAESIMGDLRRLRTKAKSILDQDNLDFATHTIALSMLRQIDAILAE